MNELKSQRNFNEEPASKKNYCMCGAQCAKAYRSNLCREKCEQSGLSKDTEKEAFPQFTAMKNFLKF